MFGLDDAIASYSDGTSLVLVALVAILLGLRHATDPDHVAAVTTLVASSRERATRHAARLGVAWGLGHAATLFLFGLPILLFGAYLPERVQQLAETAVAALIVVLAVRLLLRWHARRPHGAVAPGRPRRPHRGRRLRDRARARHGRERGRRHPHRRVGGERPLSPCSRSACSRSSRPCR